jgi:parallel beta-helix repeat protein
MQILIKNSLGLPAIVVALVSTGCGGGGSESAATDIKSAVSASTVAAATDATVIIAPGITFGTTSVAPGANADVTATLKLTEIGQTLDGDHLRAQAVAAAVAGEDNASAAINMPNMKIQSLPVAKRVFYVNSARGNDRNSGLSTNAAWMTLAKVTATPLLPGDQIRLMCGSNWSETLRINASGTATYPISVVSFPENCANQPVIDGGLPMEASAWTRYSGNIYKVALASEPNQVLASTGAMTWAHHPNRGYDSTQPTSLYLRNAADSTAITVNGKRVSNYLTTGADLVLPRGANIQPGTVVRIRTNAFTIDNSTVADVSGQRLNLATNTRYPLERGWGYFLLGQLWMLDSPGEWYYDPASKLLYAWAPDSAAPGNNLVASMLPTAVDISGTKYVQVIGLSLKRVGLGINARSTTMALVRGCIIEDTAGGGIDAGAANGDTIDSNIVTRTGGDAITVTKYGVGWGYNNVITSNRITQSGVQYRSGVQTSLPNDANAAIFAGAAATVFNNTIEDAAFNGIVPLAGSTVRGNVIRGACSVTDDCGGIYASGRNHNSTVSGNIVITTKGALAGKLDSSPSQAQGIYLDNHASGMTVRDNTVTDTDNGIQLHIAANNVIQGNRLYGNRQSQIFLQEDKAEVQATGDTFGNTISANQIVPTSATARGLHLRTQLLQETAHFGQIDKNVYLDRIFARVATDSSLSGTADYNFQQWRDVKLTNGTPRRLDENGYAASALKYAPALIAGGNLVPNGNLVAGLSGWGTFNSIKPNGTLTRESCLQGYCAKYLAGGSDGLVSTPNFSVIKGQWYRASADLLGTVDGQSVSLLVRRGGGGTNGYEQLSSVYFTAPISGIWKRVAFLFQAGATVVAHDPITLDNGARLDIEHIKVGQTLAIANIEIVPVTSATAATDTQLLINTNASGGKIDCPVSATSPALCGNFVRLVDRAPVLWPYVLDGRSAEIVFTVDPALVDSDGDGVADSQDRCPATALSTTVNALGCALGQ